jgi:hypothetical protein
VLCGVRRCKMRSNSPRSVARLVQVSATLCRLHSGICDGTVPANMVFMLLSCQVLYFFLLINFLFSGQHYFMHSLLLC